MAFVISKDTFDELKNWYTTRVGQAVPVIDNEQNIQSYTLLLHLRRTIADLIGNGTSNDGFLLSGVATDPDIGEGNIFICGLKIEQWAAIKESTQPNGTQTPPAGDGLWYLKIVLKALTPGDDPTLIDADTGIQSIDALQVDWTLLKTLGAFPTAGADEILFLLAQEVTGAFTDMRNSGTVDAGANTGFENREGGQPGDGHTHDDVKIIVDDPGYVSTDVDGALTEIDARLDSIEVGGAPPLLHASTHEIAGSDMIALDNIDGSLSDEKVILTGDVGGNANLEEHVQDGAIHAGAGAPDDASYVTINAEAGLSNETLHSDIDHSTALATSALSDLGSKDHSELTNIQGGGEHHLSSGEHGILRGGPTSDADSLHTHPAIAGGIGPSGGLLNSYGGLLKRDVGVEYTTVAQFSNHDVNFNNPSAGGSLILRCDPQTGVGILTSIMLGIKYSASSSFQPSIHLGRTAVSGAAAGERWFLDGVELYAMAPNTEGEVVTMVDAHGNSYTYPAPAGIMLIEPVLPAGDHTIEIIILADASGSVLLQVYEPWLTHVNVTSWEAYKRY